jgi:hypothetical protein
METTSARNLSLFSSDKKCSKPTVWDGDWSKCFSGIIHINKVLSPLCGIATGTLIFATLEFSHLFLMHRVELKD